jgi:hypothetical protein
MVNGSTMSRVTRAGSADATVVTGIRKRYPRRGKVSMKRGASAASPRTSRNLPDAEIQALLEVHERVARPDVFADLRARHHVAATPRQQFEDFERLRRQLHEVALVPQFARPGVQLERAKPQDGGALIENSYGTQGASMAGPVRREL